MRMTAVCPRCGSKYPVKQSLLGRKLKCRCGEVFTLKRQNDDALQGLPAIHAPAGFWDDRLDEIEDDLPKEPEPVVRKAPKPEPEANFDMSFKMDPITGTTSFGLISFAIGLVPLSIPFISFYLSPAFTILHYTFAIAPIPIFAFLAFLYSLRVYYTNQMSISISNQGIAIRHIKKLPWPCWDQVVPIDDIEDAQIECETKPSSWYLRDAEYSHSTYDSKGSRKTFVFVYELYCKCQSRRWTTRLATITDRAAAKSMRLHLKRMLQQKSKAGFEKIGL